MVQVLLFTMLLVTPLRADVFTWAFPLEPGHVAMVEIRTQDGTRLARFLSADGMQRRQAWWRPDLDPASGQVAGQVDDLWLAPGTYIVREILPTGSSQRLLDVSSGAGRMLLAQLYGSPSGVVAWKRDPGNGHSGLAWAPAFPGNITWLTVGPGEWRAIQVGTASTMEDIRPDTARIRFSPSPPPFPREQSHAGQLAVRLLLFPLILLLLAMGARGLWKARASPGLPLAAMLSLGMGLLAIWPILGSLASAVLSSDLGSTDPVDSVAQVAAMADALPSLSSVTHRFSYPEGASWIVTGPAVLGYLLPAAISWVTGPLPAHNLGVGLGLAMLAFAAWGLARSLGAGALVALLAGSCAVFSPVLLAELDLLSLDRITLFLVPVFFLCLNKAASEPGWRWPAAAGAALAAVFYGQVYYGLYLAAAAPLLVLYRLVGKAPLRRLGRMSLTGLVALLLLLPGLYVLEIGTADTPYQDDQQSFLATSTDLLHPVEPEQAMRFVEAHDPRLGGGQDPPMGTPSDRLLTAVARSLTLEEFLQPGEKLPGRGGYWLLILVALALARKRGVVLVATLDVAVLMLYALGPVLRAGGGVVGTPLPYYLDFLLVPGFEQLKQVYRFVLLAVTISAVPMALGVQGLMERLSKITLPRQLRLSMLPRPPGPWPKRLSTLAGLLALGGLTFLLVGLRLAGVSFHEWPLRVFYASRGTRALAAISLELPRVQALPLPAALEGIEPGAALALPAQDPTPARLSVASMQAGLSLVNQPPFGSSRARDMPFWFEDNAFLNGVVAESGSDRINSFLTMDDPATELSELSAAGLRYIVLFRDLLAGPELVSPTEAFLDAHLSRMADDGSVAVWEIR